MNDKPIRKEYHMNGYIIELSYTGLLDEHIREGH